MGQLDATLVLRPDVPLLDDATGLVEAEQRRPGERRDRSVDGRDDTPPVHRCPSALHDGHAEAALGFALVAERPRDILGRHLRFAERMGVEDRVRRVESSDRLDILAGPRLVPYLGPAPCGPLGVYFATSMARLSRITITFTWPGYSSWSSISRAISCERRTAPSSSTSDGSTMTRISRPACSA